MRTSNEGSANIQQQLVSGKDATNIPLYAHIANCLAPYIQAAIDMASGLSDIGIVAGATGPEEAKKLRAVLPAAPFLIPGYGAQGASAKEACAGLIRHRMGHLTGGLVNASRAITHNSAVQNAKTTEQAKQAMIAAIEMAGAELASTLSV